MGGFVPAGGLELLLRVFPPALLAAAAEGIPIQEGTPPLPLLMLMLPRLPSLARMGCTELLASLELCLRGTSRDELGCIGAARDGCDWAG